MATANRVPAGFCLLNSVLLVFWQSACATSEAPSLDLHHKLRTQRIALVSARTPIDESLEVFARSRPEAALKGAGLGIGQGLAALGGGSCGGDFCGAALLVGAALAVVVGGTVGGVIGTLHATPAERAKQMDETIHASLAQFRSHIDLSERVLAQASQHETLRVELVTMSGATEGLTPSDYQTLSAQGFDSVLEVGVTRLAFEGGVGDDPELMLHLDASASLVDLVDQKEAYSREFTYLSRPQHFSQWANQDGSEITRAFENALQTLAGSIFDQLFVEIALPISSGYWAFPGSAKYGCCYLCAESPPNDYAFWEKKLRYPSVGSPKPTLRWTAFPDADQQAQFKSHLGQEVSDVSYDLRIWEVRAESPFRLVYERYALAEPFHTLEEALTRNRNYFWSFRACFTVGEESVCTPWAASLLPAGGPDFCASGIIPDTHYYRFQTR